MVTSDGKMITEITIETRDDGKYVTFVTDKLYRAKARKLSFHYSMGWSDLEIVEDLNKSGKFPKEFFVLSSSTTIVEK